MTVLGFIGGGHATEGQIDALRRAGASVVFDDMKRLPALVGRMAAERDVRDSLTTWSLIERLRIANRTSTEMHGDTSWQA